MSSSLSATVDPYRFDRPTVRTAGIPGPYSGRYPGDDASTVDRRRDDSDAECVASAIGLDDSRARARKLGPTPLPPNVPRQHNHNDDRGEEWPPMRSVEGRAPTDLVGAVAVRATDAL